MFTLEQIQKLSKNEDRLYELLDKYETFNLFEKDLDYETKNSFWWMENQYWFMDFYSYRDEAIDSFFDENED